MCKRKVLFKTEHKYISYIHFIFYYRHVLEAGGYDDSVCWVSFSNTIRKFKG